MSAGLLPFSAASILAASMLLISALPCSAAFLKLGYLDNPGSALCRIAEAKGHFSEEGVQVSLVKFSDSAGGLAALEAGTIDVGAFEAGQSLRAIAEGKGFRVIAGGGTPVSLNPLAELDDHFSAETESHGIVVLIPPTWPGSEKGTLIQLTAALIHAYRTIRNQPASAHLIRSLKIHKNILFDPNPDYWRLERIWRSLGLQTPSMKRDFLANHVYEEIYCDALDRMLLGPIDAILQQLFSKAICTPNCCPASAAGR